MKSVRKKSKKHTINGAIFTEIVLEILKLNGRLISAGDRLVSDLGLTSARWLVMGAAIEEEPLTVSQIARKMELQRQSVQRIVDLLAKEELIALIDNPNHQRAKLVKLSRKGGSLLKKVNKYQQEWANSIAANFDRAELRSANTLLKELHGLL
jgi:DNA-binding MarR family transcriptional regulator